MLTLRDKKLRKLNGKDSAKRMFRDTINYEISFTYIF